jgi:hypothetical protein
VVQAAATAEMRVHSGDAWEASFRKPPSWPAGSTIYYRKFPFVRQCLAPGTPVPGKAAFDLWKSAMMSPGPGGLPPQPGMTSNAPVPPPGMPQAGPSALPPPPPGGGAPMPGMPPGSPPPGGDPNAQGAPPGAQPGMPQGPMDPTTKVPGATPATPEGIMQALQKARFGAHANPDLEHGNAL